MFVLVIFSELLCKLLPQHTYLAERYISNFEQADSLVMYINYSSDYKALVLVIKDGLYVTLVFINNLIS